MKTVLMVILLFISFYSFSDNNDQDVKRDKLISLDLVLGVKYYDIHESDEFVLTDMRAGASLDLFFNINNNIGIGADAGFYTIYDADNSSLLFDIPLNGIVKFSFGKLIALEAYGGMFIEGYMLGNQSNDTFTDMYTNAGGRFVIWNFYFESAYIFTDPGKYTIGAGIIVKF